MGLFSLQAAVAKMCLSTSRLLSGPGCVRSTRDKPSSTRFRASAAKSPRPTLGSSSGIRSDRMSALCQKRTFRPLLGIIVGGQGCSSSWSITRETSPPKISASGSGHCRAADHSAHRVGAGLSGAAGAHHCRICPRWWHRHHWTPGRTMAVGAARPAIRYREPTRSRQQYRHRDGRERAPGTAIRSLWPLS